MSGLLAILCSGQGTQHRDMFCLTGDAPAAREVFDAASSVLGHDPRVFVSDADDAALYSNRAGQVLCCTQALAAWKAIDWPRGRPVLFAGYSVGELAAWGCAGAIDVPTLMTLAATRAELMDRAAPRYAGLAAISGLRRATLDEMLAGDDSQVAIINGIDSFIIGGRNDNLNAIIEKARSSGARVARKLRIAIPSHTACMDAAYHAFNGVLAKSTIHPLNAGSALLSGIDGSIMRDPSSGTERLARQISHSIDWDACLTTLVERGATTFLELGPGHSLTAMAAKRPNSKTKSIEGFRSLDGLRQWCERALENR